MNSYSAIQQAVQETLMDGARLQDVLLILTLWLQRYLISLTKGDWGWEVRYGKGELKGFATLPEALSFALEQVQQYRAEK